MAEGHLGFVLSGPFLALVPSSWGFAEALSVKYVSYQKGLLFRAKVPMSSASVLQPGVKGLLY
jgi:hypothetical protein